MIGSPSRISVPETAQLERVAELLGGSRILRRRLSSPLDAHEMLLNGLPAKALTHLVDNLVVLHRTASLEQAVGMSLRTFQRRKDSSAKPLNQEQSGRTWEIRRDPRQGDGHFRFAGGGGAMAGASGHRPRPAPSNRPPRDASRSGARRGLPAAS